MNLDERFWSKVDGGNVETCWLWTAGTWKGYGQIRVNDQMLKAHRVAWALLRGDIPEGLTVDHLCFVTRCVNPWHLELVSAAENSRRVRANQHSGKTHYFRGHEFTPENTRRLTRGRRSCKACERIRLHKSRAKKRASRTFAAA